MRCGSTWAGVVVDRRYIRLLSIRLFSRFTVCYSVRTAKPVPQNKEIIQPRHFALTFQTLQRGSWK